MAHVPDRLSSYAASTGKSPSEEVDELDMVDADEDVDIDDEEVDQLDSDTEEDVGSSASAHGPRKSRSKQARQPRVPGQTSIPQERLESILNAEDLAGSMSKDAFFLVSAAAEEFLRKLTEAGHRQAGAEGRSDIAYHHLVAATRQYQELMFLKDTIPEPISIVDALERRAEKMKEGPLEPVVMSTPVVGSIASGVSQHQPNIKTKGMSRTRSNKSNGDPTYKKPRTRDTKGRYGGAGADSTASSSVDGPTRVSRPRRSRTRQTSPEGAPYANGGPSSLSPPHSHSHGHAYANGRQHAPWDGPPLQLPLAPMAVGAHPHPLQSPPVPGEADHRWTSGGPHYIAAHFVQEEPWQHANAQRSHLHPMHADERRRERGSQERHHAHASSSHSPRQARRENRTSGTPPVQDERGRAHFGGERAGRTIYSQNS